MLEYLSIAWNAVAFLHLSGMQLEFCRRPRVRGSAARATQRNTQLWRLLRADRQCENHEKICSCLRKDEVRLK